MTADDRAERARQRFDDSFERLRAESNLAETVERTPENLDRLVDEHLRLEQLRDEAWQAKKGIVSRYEPAAPDWVEPPVGVQETSRRGRVFAIIGGLLVAAIVPIVAIAWARNQVDVAISVGDQRVVEELTDDGRRRCFLEIRLRVDNNSGSILDISRATAVIDRRSVTVGTAAIEPVLTGHTTTRTLSAIVGAVTSNPCPSLETIDRGSLTVDLISLPGEPIVDVRRSTSL